MSDIAAKDLSLTASRILKAPPRAVYEAWLDPAKMKLFFGSCKGEDAQDIEVDARVGGKFLIPMPSPGGKVLHDGEYLELVPYSRIVFTWNSIHVNPGTVVTVTLKEVAAGTELHLLHEKFATEGSRNGHSGGWAAILDKLVEVYA